MSGNRRWIFFFHELGKEHNDLVGKKCANLGDMAKAGLRVPPGFAISVEAWAQFIQITGLGDKIRRFFEEHMEEFGVPSRGQELSHKVRELIETQKMPDEITREIVQSYRLLSQTCKAEDIAVAVRSSGVVSMPGAMETYLNVKGEKEVIEKVLRVWGSAYTHRAILYRFRQGLPMDYAPIGVGVMQLVNARVAGVMMTANPQTGNISEIVIESNWGMGESVVSGIVSPDRYILDKKSMHILDRVLNRKLKRVMVRESSGVETVDIPYESQEMTSLTDEQVTSLAKVGIKIEEDFGVPMDIEWAYDVTSPSPEHMFILQARPIKALPEYRDKIDRLLDMMLNMK